MCNCSRKRNTIAARNTTMGNAQVRVQLTGSGPVTFYGSYTGRMYRLLSTNAIVLVDSRDAANLGGVPGVRVI